MNDLGGGALLRFSILRDERIRDDYIRNKNLKCVCKCK
jgi:hypothetical protein